MAEDMPEVAALYDAIDAYVHALFGGGVVTSCLVAFEARQAIPDDRVDDITMRTVNGYCLPGNTTGMAAVGLAHWAREALTHDPAPPHD